MSLDSYDLFLKNADPLYHTFIIDHLSANLDREKLWPWFCLLLRIAYFIDWCSWLLRRTLIHCFSGWICQILRLFRGRNTSWLRSSFAFYEFSSLCLECITWALLTHTICREHSYQILTQLLVISWCGANTALHDREFHPRIFVNLWSRFKAGLHEHLCILGRLQLVVSQVYHESPELVCISIYQDWFCLHTSFLVLSQIDFAWPVQVWYIGWLRLKKLGALLSHDLECLCAVIDLVWRWASHDLVEEVKGDASLVREKTWLLLK